jgi:hypothetical protein
MQNMEGGALMPGGRYNLQTIEGIDKKLTSLRNKKSDLLVEADGIEQQIVHLEKTREGLVNAEVLEMIKASGKPIEEVRELLKTTLSA